MFFMALNNLLRSNLFWSIFRVVGIATGYRLDNQGVAVRVPVVSRIFSTSSRLALGSTQPPTQWVPGALSLGGKAGGIWGWVLTSNECQGQEIVDLCIHSPMRIHGVMLN
jgi:hypothetical protein